jgi:hypothetical protein
MVLSCVELCEASDWMKRWAKIGCVGENASLGHNIAVKAARTRPVTDDESSRLPESRPKNLVSRNGSFSALYRNNQIGSGMPHGLVHCLDDTLRRLSGRQWAITVETSHMGHRRLPAEDSQTDPYEPQQSPHGRTPDGRL